MTELLEKKKKQRKKNTAAQTGFSPLGRSRSGSGSFKKKKKGGRKRVKEAADLKRSLLLFALYCEIVTATSYEKQYTMEQRVFSCMLKCVRVMDTLTSTKGRTPNSITLAFVSKRQKSTLFFFQSK